jgi:predicted RNA methylase
MTTQEIVAKLWNLCNVLRDDGITYHQYVTELTYILFLKMAKETGAEEQIPAAYRWDVLTSKSGIELKNYYRDLLDALGENGQGRVKDIYQGAATNIDEPKNLEKIITTIDALDWFSAREEGLGNLYEGLLEKNANEKKSGAGQYFTPRVLIDVMTRLAKPQPGERCNDPACGTFGFMIAAHQYVSDHTDEFSDLDADTAEFEQKEAFTGCELVHDTHRLALMNAMLHDIDGEILLGDTLSNFGKQMHDYDLVLTNPPFGTKKGGERATRDDFTYPTSNKQLNFLQHIYRSLKRDGHARAAAEAVCDEIDATKKPSSRKHFAENGSSAHKKSLALSVKAGGFILFVAVRLDGVVAVFSGADADGVADFVAEDFSVARLTGVGGVFDGVDGFLLPFFGGDDDLELDLWLHLHLDLHAADDFAVAFAGAAAHHLGDGQPVDADFRQGVLDFFKFFFAHDGFNFDQHSFTSFSFLSPSR